MHISFHFMGLGFILAGILDQFIAQNTWYKHNSLKNYQHDYLVGANYGTMVSRCSLTLASDWLATRSGNGNDNGQRTPNQRVFGDIWCKTMEKSNITTMGLWSLSAWVMEVDHSVMRWVVGNPSTRGLDRYCFKEQAAPYSGHILSMHNELHGGPTILSSAWGQHANIRKKMVLGGGKCYVPWTWEHSPQNMENVLVQSYMQNF